MSSLFPFQSPVGNTADEEPQLVEISEDAADDVFAALSSSTARSLLAAVYEEPRPASALAETVETSIQNARYHLEKLSDAGLIEVADTWYSERGSEMNVYAATNESLVVFAGEQSTSSLRSLLRTVLGSVGVLGIGSVAVEWLANRSQVSPSGDGGVDGDGPDGPANQTTAGPSHAAESAQNDSVTTAATETASNETTANQTATTLEKTTQATASSDQLSEFLSSPGVLFFAGGMLVIAVVLSWYYLRVIR